MSRKDRRDIICGILCVLALVAVIALTGCIKSSTASDTVKQDRIVISGSLTIPTAEGPKAVPISFSVDRRGTEAIESKTQTGPDGAAIGREIAAALGPLLAAGTGGAPWGQLLGGIGGAGTLATTAYLAMQKRKQMRQETRPRTSSNSG